MRIRLDTRMLRRTARDAANRHKSVRITFKGAGTGEVLVSKRRKLPWEKRRAIHGKAIANMLAAKGHDPFSYPDDVVEESQETISTTYQRAIRRAFRLKRHQLPMIREALRQEAERLAEIARDRVISGKVGRNPPEYRKRKARLVERGRATGEYGTPPPYGVLTGRFVAGFRARWRRGRVR